MQIKELIEKYDRLFNLCDEVLNNIEQIKDIEVASYDRTNNE